VLFGQTVYIVRSAPVLIIALSLMIIHPRGMNVALPENLWVILFACGAAFAGRFASHMLLHNEEKEVATPLHSMHGILGNGTQGRFYNEWTGEETYV
jgi:hypothetical protein